MANYFTIEKILDWFFEFGETIINCILILVICFFIIKISRHGVEKFFSMQTSKGKFGLNERKSNTLCSIITSVIKYLFYFIALFAILVRLGIPATSLVAVASAGSVAIGLGAKSLMQDVIEGFFILLEDQFGVGDIVTIQGYTGTVESISIRTTRIRGFDGTVYIIPNGTIGVVTNMCKEYINAIVDIDIDYDENIEHVLKILNNEMDIAAKEIKGFQNPPVVLGVTGLNESAVTIRITAACDIKENYRIERELRLRIKNRLDKEGITIPFPQRTLHIVKDKDHMLSKEM